MIRPGVFTAGWSQYSGMMVQMAGPQGPALPAAAMVLVLKMKQLLSTPGTGRFYKSRGLAQVGQGGRRLGRSGTKLRAQQLHQASSPGMPPAPDTGELRRSIRVEILPSRVRVGTPLPYAAALEFGTVINREVKGVRLQGLNSRLKKSRGFGRLDLAQQKVRSVRSLSGGVIAPRPFMRPALQMAREEMTQAWVAKLQILGPGR
jgi:hypothetical protein